MKKLIIDYFEETVSAYREKRAVADLEESLSYGELQQKSMAIGTAIAGESVSDRPVALLFERSVRLPAAMLGALYSGCFYTVLDPESPAERLAKIMDTLRPKVLLCEEKTQRLAGEIAGNTECISFEAAENTEIQRDLLREIRRKLTSESPAYVLFTSGSSGDPKGAVLTNLNVISYIHWFTDCFEIDSSTVFGAQTPLYFSMSVSDFYSAIFTGAAYEMIPKTYFSFPARLVSHMNERGVNTIYWVPSALGIVAKLDLFRYTKPEHLQKILFAGERMPVKYLNYFKGYLGDALYANLFGPTETTDICTYYIADRDFTEDEVLPIGKPCEGCEVFLVDGELYVKGPFVAKGYYGDREATEKAFVQNPLHRDYIDIVYKTGDIAAVKEDGNLWYGGRKDFQIKHMGYRIEPEEIENALGNGAGINAVCIYDGQQDRLILAYESEEELEEDLRTTAAKKLPAYMQPEAYRRFSRFPVNHNGKTDRKAIKDEILN